MGHPQVGIDYSLIARYLRRSAPGDELAGVEDQYFRSKRKDEIHIVFHQQKAYSRFSGEAVDKICHMVFFAAVQPGGNFIGDSPMKLPPG